jgi:HEAT repeat protein
MDFGRSKRHFYLLNDSAEQKTKAIIQGKRITREKILKIIQEHSSTQILDIGKAEEEAQQEQAIEKQAIAYRQKLISGLCNLQIFKMSSPLNLKEIYVKLRVRQEEKLPSAKEEERVSLAGDEPTELLRLFQGRLAEQAATAMSPEEALSRFKKITVLGEPGAGKTMVLLHLAVEMASGALPNLPDLPVYVELRSFVESGMEDLLDFVVSNCAKPYNFPARSYLEKKLKEGEAALLLDGLDEVLGGKSPEEAKKVYSRLAKLVTGLATQFSVVACRRAGWQGGLTGFHTLEVLDFDEPQIQEFVNNWFNSDPSKAKGLQQELEKNLRMNTLAANPLILSLMAIVYQRELKLPERRSELYQHCVEVLLEEWDSEPNRGINRFNQFTPTQMQNLLIEVAWYFHQQGKGYFREAELLRQLPKFLSNSDINIPLQDNKAILEEITGSSSLLKEAAYKLYGFLHLTFQEYFAALAAKKKGSIGWQEVVAHRHEPWWEEVILLLAECMDDATPLLLGILGHPLGQLLPGDINQLVPEGKPLAVNDDLFHSDLLLAARCLVGKPQILMQGLRDRIIAEIKHLLPTSAYELDWNRAARVLVEIGENHLIDDLLATLADNNIELGKRYYIASALGEVGNQSIPQHLLKLLESVEIRHSIVGKGILGAIADLEATFAANDLLHLLKAEMNCEVQFIEVQFNFVEVLGKIGKGNKHVVSDLMERLLHHTPFPLLEPQIARSVGRLGEKSVAPKLLEMLLSENTHPEIKLGIAQALRDLKNKSLTNFILKRLEDKKIDWKIRWLLTESLEGLQEGAINPLREMLKNPHLDNRVQVGIAATLGTWGIKESIPYLCKAIENQVVPPNWEFFIKYSAGKTGIVEHGYVWKRIIRTLKNLGDDSIVPALVKAFKQRTPEQNKCVRSKEWLNEVKGIIIAVPECQNPAITQQLLEMLSQPEWKSFQNELLRSLSKLTTKSLVPEFLNLLSERSIYKADEWRWLEIVYAIGGVADNLETVRALQETMPAMPSSKVENDLLSAIYSALYSVSRRARVRVSRDGQIEELQN